MSLLSPSLHLRKASKSPEAFGGPCPSSWGALPIRFIFTVRPGAPLLWPLKNIACQSRGLAAESTAATRLAVCAFLPTLGAGLLLKPSFIHCDFSVVSPARLHPVSCVHRVGRKRGPTVLLNVFDLYLLVIRVCLRCSFIELFV